MKPSSLLAGRMNEIEVVMSEEALADKVRQRIETEDELLNSRTTIFLGINGLWAAAVGIGNAPHLQIGITILGVLVSIMWLMCSWQSWQAIKALTRKHHQLADDPVEEIVSGALWSRRLRPTNILAHWLPTLFLFIWIVFLSWLLWSSLA
jgi:hypothetical protein